MKFKLCFYCILLLIAIGAICMKVCQAVKSINGRKAINVVGKNSVKALSVMKNVGKGTRWSEDH